MEYEENEEGEVDIREGLSTAERSVDAQLSIDPGFVHYGLIETLLGERGTFIIDQQIHELPDLPDWQKPVRIGHIYTKTLLAVCGIWNVPTLRQLLGNGTDRLFCSVESLTPCTDIYTSERATSTILLPGYDANEIVLELSTSRITSSTTKMELEMGHEVAIIGQFHRRTGNRMIFRPLVIGAPWLSSEDEIFPDETAMWWGHHFFENFVEDIDEFSQVRDTPLPSDISVMKRVSESAFKACMAEILGEQPGKDWGGETSDHFSAHLHIGGKRVSAAFLLKGPARFAPMGLNHLGKNNDQIYRLSQEPADLLVVQHCHDVGPAVRATLRAFTVQPGKPRRYCVMDGRDSLRLLLAYNKLDHALELSEASAAD